MGTGLISLEAKNFRCLRRTKLDTGPINVFFGPNGAGKSTLLDTLWLVRDCAIRGVDVASANRSHGIGMRWDKAAEDEPISVTLTTRQTRYEVIFGTSAGKIEPFVGENLHAIDRGRDLIKRIAGSDSARFLHGGLKQMGSYKLREPEKLALSRYVLFEDGFDAANEMDKLLHDVHFYHLRSLDLYGLRVAQSSSSLISESSSEVNSSEEKM